MNATSAQLAGLLSCLQDFNLREGADLRVTKSTGKPYTARDAYAALLSTEDMRHQTPVVATFG
jgi:hypothetical protein